MATLWVLGSDAAMLELAPALSDLAWMGTVKGLSFVAVTTALLYGVLARERAAQARSAARLHLLETALSATASAVVITDRTGVIEWVNRAFTTLTGYRQGEAIGQNPRLLRSGHHPQAFYTQMWATVLRGAVWRGELVNRRKDGSLYHEEQTITPVRRDGATITHFIGIKQDVSARVSREREQSVLATLAAALRTTTSRRQIPLTLLHQLETLLQVDGAALALDDPLSSLALVEAGVGALAPLAGSRLPARAGLLVPGCAGGCQDQTTRLLAEPALCAGSLFETTYASVCTPLWIDGAAIGTLLTAYGAPPSEAECRLLRQVADMAASAIHRATLHEQTARRLQRLTSLQTIDQTLAATLDLSRTLDTALDQILAQLAVDAAAVLLVDADQRHLRYRAGAGFRGESITETQVALGEGLLGEAVLARRAIRLPLIPVIGETFTRGTLLGAEGFKAYYALPLIAKGQVKGVLELFHRSPLACDAEWLSFLETLAGHIALAIDYAELVEHLRQTNEELARAYDSTLEGWARALELRDSETEGHSRRVTALTEQLARAVGVPDEQLEHIRRGALLHDIGKMGVPDAILHKPGPLTAEEWATMREHPGHAFRLLSPIAYLRPALDIPYAHHERWDGSGYPRGLVGEAIPLAARIFAVVDVWDALTTKRPYKEAWSSKQACRYLREQAGIQFDPTIVNAFLDVLAQPSDPPGQGAPTLDVSYEPGIAEPW